MDPYKELEENRAALAELFASKGWEILLKWTKEQVKVKFEKAIRRENAQEREENRISGLAMEEFIRLAVFLAEKAGLGEDLAEGASAHAEQTTPDA